MNKTKWMATILLAVMMTSCGNASDVEKGTQEGIVMESNEEIVEGTFVSEEPETLPSGCVDAKEYVQSLNVVEEYADGKYVVCGTNLENKDFCGVLYENGMLKVYEGYTRIYPLQEGRLLAATEEKPRDMSYVRSSIQHATVSGVIIDEEGNPIFSEEGSFRFVPIAKDRLLTFKAASGFDGVVFEFGVLDSDGNWVTELSSDNEVALLLKDNVNISTDGSWKFTDSPSEEQYTDEKGLYYKKQWIAFFKDLDSVQITIYQDAKLVAPSMEYVNADLDELQPEQVRCTFTYDARTDDCVKGSFEYAFLSQDLPEQHYKMLSDGTLLFSTSLWASRDYSYDIDSKAGEKSGEVRGFYIDEDYCFDSQNGAIKNIVTGQTIPLSETICSHMQNIYLHNDIFYAILKGDDNLQYIQRLGIDEEPVRLEHFLYDGLLFYDDCFLYCNEDEGTVYIVDSENLEIVQEVLLDMEGPSFRLHKMDDSTFAVEGFYSGRSQTSCAIYRLDGERLL